MSILSLAPETFEEILGNLPTQHDRQQATLQLTRAIPRAPIPLQHLFEVVKLHDASQVESFYRRIWSVGSVKEDGVDGKAVGDAPMEDAVCQCTRMIHSLHVNTFDADPEVVLNILALVQDVDHLKISVGSTFKPEHLQAALDKPRRKLRSLEIRFHLRSTKPVSLSPNKSDSYYDAALSVLARWPAPSSNTAALDARHAGLRSFSLIQEHFPTNSVPCYDNMLDADTVVKTPESVFQPTAFSSFEPLTDLLSSHAMSSLRSLTVRIPEKDNVIHLFHAGTAFPSVLSTSWSCASRSITHFDFSTTGASLRHLKCVLPYMSSLTHLVLDETGIILLGKPQKNWKRLGKTCALTGLHGAVLVKIHLETSTKYDARFASLRARLLTVAVESDSAWATLDSFNESTGKPPLKRGYGSAHAYISEKMSSFQQGVSSYLPLPSSTGGDSPQHLKSRLALSAEKQISFVPFPPALRSLRVFQPCDREYNKKEEEAAKGMFKKGWETGLRELREEWRSLQAKIAELSSTSSSSEVILMFRDTFNDENEWDEIGEPRSEGIYQEEELVLATMEALETLLVRVFPCPELHFVRENDDGLAS